MPTTTKTGSKLLPVPTLKRSTIDKRVLVGRVLTYDARAYRVIYLGGTVKTLVRIGCQLHTIGEWRRRAAGIIEREVEMPQREPVRGCDCATCEASYRATLAVVRSARRQGLTTGRAYRAAVRRTLLVLLDRAEKRLANTKPIEEWRVGGHALDL
jgi:hypothetical protein